MSQTDALETPRAARADAVDAAAGAVPARHGRLSMLKGLYHWSLVLGIGDGSGSTFEQASMPWQAATIFFAVIDLVAAVGLWLAAAWGGVVWLTAAISMAAIELFFPQVYRRADLDRAARVRGDLRLYRASR